MVGTTHNIIILGGGFGGLRCALDLERRLPPEYSVILIDKEAYHTFTPWLYEAATALPRNSNERNQFYEIRKATAIGFTELLRGKRIHFFQKEVEGIHLTDRAITFAGGSIARYDYLVIALGSVANFYSTPGMAGGAYPLKTLNDALTVRAQVYELFERTPRDPYLTIAIVGGGLNGVELAGECARMLKHLCTQFRRDPKTVSLTLLESRPTLLTDLRPRVQHEAMNRLKHLNVSVRTNQHVANYTGQYLLFQDGQQLEVDLCIWAAGIKGNPLGEAISGVQQENGFLCVEPSLQIAGFPTVYAIGDMAYIEDPHKLMRASATAQKAMVQGTLAAENIARSLAGQPPTLFRPLPARYAVPIGGKYALVDAGIITIAGILGWWVKSIIHFKYLWSIMPLHKAMVHWVETTWLGVQND